MTKQAKPPISLSAVLVFLIPLIAVVAPRALPLLPLLFGLLVVLFFRTKAWDLAKTIPQHFMFEIVALLATWGLISCLYSPAGDDAVNLWVRLGWLGFLGFLMLKTPINPAQLKPALMRGLWISYAIVSIVFIYILISPNGIPSGQEGNYAWFNRSLAGFSVLIWVLLDDLWHKHKGKALIAFAWLLFMLSQLASLSAFGAVLFGVIAFLIAQNSKGRQAMSYLIPLGLIAFPMIFFYLPKPEMIEQLHPELPFSTIHRFYIWNFVHEQIVQNPYLGYGLDAARAMVGGHTRTHFGGELLPSHPHNASLQLWLELGMVGLTIFATMVFQIAQRLCKSEKPMLGFALLVSYLTVGGAGYGVWQNWWIAVIFLAAFSYRIITVKQK